MKAKKVIERVSCKVYEWRQQTNKEFRYQFDWFSEVRRIKFLVCLRSRNLFLPDKEKILKFVFKEKVYH